MQFSYNAFKIKKEEEKNKNTTDKVTLQIHIHCYRKCTPFDNFRCSNVIVSMEKKNSSRCSTWKSSRQYNAFGTLHDPERVPFIWWSILPFCFASYKRTKNTFPFRLLFFQTSKTQVHFYKHFVSIHTLKYNLKQILFCTSFSSVSLFVEFMKCIQHLMQVRFFFLRQTYS